MEKKTCKRKLSWDLTVFLPEGGHFLSGSNQSAVYKLMEENELLRDNQLAAKIVAIFEGSYCLIF